MLVQALQLTEVLDQHGAEHLETWAIPLLTWPELQALKAEHEQQSAARTLEGRQRGMSHTGTALRLPGSCDS